MSRRIACLALTAAALIVTPAFTEQLQRPAAAQQRFSSQGSKPAAFGGHRGLRTHHRAHRHLRRAPAFWPGAGFIDVPSTGNTNIAVASVYPSVFADPSWRLCQFGPGDDNPYLCGPYSYYPYGAYGYRPYGSYRPHRSGPVYLGASGARIIRIESDGD